MPRPIRPQKDGPWCWANKAILRRLSVADPESSEGCCRIRSLYLALCEIASDGVDGKPPSPIFQIAKGTLAFRAGMSPKTVQRMLPILEQAGVLHVERAAKGIKIASTYTLLAASSGRDDPAKGLADPTRGLDPDKGQMARLYEEQEEQKFGEPAIKGGSVTIAESTVIEIYQAYPRKEARPAALKAIRKAIAKKPADELLEVTQAYAAAIVAWPEDDRKFVPHPATWFNQERFNDDPQTWVRETSGRRAGFA